MHRGGTRSLKLRPTVPPCVRASSAGYGATVTLMTSHSPAMVM
jgi:hypothetical protein